jgi:enoyl-CoA hydratase/carnithine racemase
MWICIMRPHKANALTAGMMESMREMLAEGAGDEAVRVLLLTGAGDRVFCAGADVREKPADGDLKAHRSRRSRAMFDLLTAVTENPKPVVAVLNGVASGGGAMLALVSDARVAVDTAELALPEIDLGMPTFAGASVALEVGGLALAADLVQSGRRMPAEEARARGLLNAVAPRSGLESAAMDVARPLAQKAPAAFAANKQWLTRRLRTALAEARGAAEAHRSRHP